MIAVAADRREIRTVDSEGRCQGLIEMPANVTSLVGAQSGFVCVYGQGIARLDLVS